MTEQKQYKLYAVRNGKIKDSELKAFEYSLQPFNATYTLIYTDKVLQEPYREIGAEVPLTAQEKQWLLSVKMKINTAYVKDNLQEYENFLNQFTERLEEELKAEQEKIKGESNNA